MSENAASSAPIGVFDSGVGGLSVLRQMRAQLPHENLIYLADQAHVPYGPRAKAEIRQFSEAITRFFLECGVKLVVVACNTASAAALSTLRRTFPALPFVGMEPAVKPAAARTKTGKVGVLATQGTFSSERYAELMARFAQNVAVYEDPCFGLVDLIESGQAASAKTARVLRHIVDPMLAAGVDTLVLGCTHYPFVIPVLAQAAGTAVAIIDPAPAVARQVERVLQHANLLAAKQPVRLNFVTTGSPANFARQIEQLWGDEHEVKTAVWREENQKLILQSDQLPL